MCIRDSYFLSRLKIFFTVFLCHHYSPVVIAGQALPHTKRTNIYSTILIPMLRAVPERIFSAPSMVIALRSTIFCSASVRNCLRVICPADVRLGVPEPLSTPAALRSKSAAGGVFKAIVKERSEKMVTSTGTMAVSYTHLDVYKRQVLF